MISGTIHANKTIWLIGDVYLTEALAVLTQHQNMNRDELYIYQAYDVKAFFPKRQCADTFGKIIRSMLYEALKQYNNLPAIIIVITGNQKIDDMVSTPFHTKRIWKAVCNKIDRAVKARKNDLPRKAFLNEEPRVFFTNVFPRSKNNCERVDEGFDTFKTKRRRLNNLLPQVAQAYGFNVLNISGIMPDDHENFVESTGILTGKGMLSFWKSVSQELRLADEKLKQRVRNNIINAYLEEERELQKINMEKQKLDSNSFPSQKTYDHHDQHRNQNNFNRPVRGKGRFNWNRARGHSATR